MQHAQDLQLCTFSFLSFSICFVWNLSLYFFFTEIDRQTTYIALGISIPSIIIIVLGSAVIIFAARRYGKIYNHCHSFVFFLNVLSHNTQFHIEINKYLAVVLINEGLFSVSDLIVINLGWQQGFNTSTIWTTVQQNIIPTACKRAGFLLRHLIHFWCSRFSEFYYILFHILVLFYLTGFVYVVYVKTLAPNRLVFFIDVTFVYF